MSGYNDHELCMTPFNEPPSAVVGRARAFLRAGYSMFEQTEWGGLLEIEGQGSGEYRLGESLDPNDEELDEYVQMGAGVQILQRIKFLRAHYSMMLNIIPVEGYCCGLLWKIESRTFDRIRSWDREAEWDQSMKTAFAGWVYGLARACDADGFILKRDSDELRVYTHEEICQHLTRTDFDWNDPLNGATISGLSNLPLSRVHGGQRQEKHYCYTVFGRYTVMDIMHHPEPDDDDD